MIHIENLSVTRNGRCICSVGGLEVTDGERLVVLGPNGCGKTTLFRVLAGLEDGFQGSCKVAVARGQRVYVDQNPYLFRGTVRDNVLYGLRAHGFSRGCAHRLATEWMDRLNVGGRANQSVDQLSGGERRRTALARAIVLRPRLLLLDEPLAEMDSDGVACVCRAMDELPETTILLTSPTDLPPSLVTREFRMG